MQGVRLGGFDGCQAKSGKRGGELTAKAFRRSAGGLVRTSAPGALLPAGQLLQPLAELLNGLALIGE